MQRAQAGTGPWCADMNMSQQRGLDIWCLTWAQSGQFNSGPKQLARKRTGLLISLLLLSTGRMLSFVVVSPS